MTGHGSPRTSPTVLAFGSPWLVRALTAALLWATLLPAVAVAAGEMSFRIRLAWGAGQPRQWRGSVGVESGTVSEPRALGIEADEPGSIWCQRGVAWIEQKSVRSYDGCDLTVTAPVDARLNVRLWAADGPRQPVQIDVPLAELIASQHSTSLDEQGNRLLVQRLPGDMLRVRMNRRAESADDDRLIYWAGDLLRWELAPHLLGVAAGTALRVTAEFSATGSDDILWSESRDWTAPAADVSASSMPFSITLPDAEGVYELRLAVRRGGFRNRIGLSQLVIERKVQFVVLERNPVAAPLHRTSPPTELEEIDPASPSWWDRLASMPLVPGQRRGPLSGQYAETIDHALGRLVMLPTSSPASEPSWEAYPLPVSQPGRPHVLEVDLPSDVEQAIGISIVEPNAAGAVMPIGLDSGVYRSREDVESAARWTTHRLIFWPRTKTPLVLISNQHASAAAVFGKMRLLNYEGRLPTAFDTGGARPERLLAGYYARPLFPENFSAAESLDPVSGRSLDDWGTFYQGSSRLVDYLNHTGRNGLMLSVWADGSTIYPSRLLEPTPRYDTGTFFASAQDPQRKDVLELLFRLFDREGLQLIPALHFASPLPALENQKRIGGPESVGLEWIGAEGKTWLQTHGARRGNAPYYNALNSRVQQAMLGVVRELADRYGHHASFRGIAVVLSADGYAQLPGARWGYDDDTIAQYERDTQVRVPGAGPGRFAMRDRTLQGEQRAQWLQWRAASLATLHERMQAELARTKPSGKLYLTSVETLSAENNQRELRPVLPRTVSIPAALLEVGIDAAQYAEKDQIVLTRPVPIAPLDRLYSDSSRAVDLALSQAVSIDTEFTAAGETAGMFYHPPRQGRIFSFEENSPFQPTYSWQVAQLLPAEKKNRQRFARAIATMDVQTIFDGGWLLPLGQEDALDGLVEVYRRLPGTRFSTVAGATQPVTIRTLKRDGVTYVYMVNDSPWPAIVEVGLRGANTAPLESLSSRRLPSPIRGMDGSVAWNVPLEPYGLVGARFGAENVELIEPRTRLTKPNVHVELRDRIERLWGRAAVLMENRPLQGLENGNFDAPTDDVGRVPNWVVAGRGRPSATLEDYQPHSGTHSVRFRGDGLVASFWSDTFGPPRTGRLAVSVWLRIPDPARQPPLRLAVEGQYQGTSYYRHAKVGADSPEQIGETWNRFIFPVPELPLEGLSELRVRFDLMGPGEVWIDDVEIYESAFSDSELTELGSIINLASDYLNRGRVRDSLHVLQGYWPRFLEDRVTGMPTPVASGRETTGATPPPEAKKPGFLQGWKNRLVPKFLR